MHTLQKIKIFRFLLYLTYLPSLLLVYPFALLRAKNRSHLFFFFDRYGIGGAQRIHLDILHSLPDVHKQLYFTRLSKDKNLKEAFYGVPGTDARDIHTWCDNLLFRLFTVHYFAFYINRHPKAHVFSSNSTFFFDMLPFLRKDVVKTELLHNFTHGKNGMEFFGLGNVHYLQYRVVYDNFTFNNIHQQYAKYGVADAMKDRILFIEPGVVIHTTEGKNYAPPLRVLYAGRGGPQKRIPLLNRVAEQCLDRNLPIEFHFAGTMMDELSEVVKSKSVIHGEVREASEMNRLYQNCNVILMTSAYEGFPMLIKEGMAWGCIPVVTALEGNKTHLHHGQNALLINEPENEEGVVKQGIELLAYLAADQERLRSLSADAYQYAREHFDREAFMQRYRDFLMG
ncbi:MAG: glycosyltransferase family 4 protein [Flavipsychrobacter sp.]|nr:glycosyltransferase family 4 protein [Flavipsychrobacter sp.]